MIITKVGIILLWIGCIRMVYRYCVGHWLAARRLPRLCSLQNRKASASN